MDDKERIEQHEERLKRLEDVAFIVKDAIVNHSERMDDFLLALENERRGREEFNKDFEFKLNALIDAQLRNETNIRELKESSKELKEASQAQLKRIEILESK
jgi:predicted DNA-binding protein